MFDEIKFLVCACNNVFPVNITSWSHITSIVYYNIFVQTNLSKQTFWTAGCLAGIERTVAWVGHWFIRILF